MRILWINPIGTARHDDAMAAALAGARRPGTSGAVVSYAPGVVPGHLEYDAFEAFAVPQIVLTARWAAAEGFDAMVIGCFHDTALEAAREVSGGMIVTGPCSAGLEVAAALSQRASILSPSAKSSGHMRRRIRELGAGHRIASFRNLGILTPELTRDPALTEARVEEEARRAVEEDGAQAILLGCTLEYAAAQAIGDRLGVPLIDAVRAPFAQAETLVHAARHFGWRPGRVGATVAPSENEIGAAGTFAAPAIANRVEF